MKESKLKVYKFCAFCAPSCQTIGAGPVSRASLVGFNAVIPFLLALKRYGAFGREETLGKREEMLSDNYDSFFISSKLDKLVATA